MRSRIEARSIGGILDDVFRQYRKYFGPLFLISLVFLAPIIILDSFVSSQVPTLQYQALLSGHTTISQFFQSTHTTTASIIEGIGALIVSLLSMNVSSPLTEGAYYALAQDTLVHDRTRPSPWRYVRLAVSRWGAYLATLWLLIGLTVLLFAVLIGIAALIGMTHSAALGGLFSIVSFIIAIAFIWLAIRLLFVFAAVFLERKRNWGAIARSYRLTAGSFWRIFGILVISYLVLGFAAAGLGAVFNLVLPLNVLSVVGSGLVSILLAPLFNLLVANLYLDLRVRREGYEVDLEETTDD
ncbi:MAG: hypothetical protein OWT28_11270 [Firmicutes bacterium]|nr:hypothetical protein [Bacillota bacterium]